MSHNRLSEEQLAAINHFTGPALVVAGPGSGKTTVIINRINYLIYKKHIKPQNILVITFTKMAAISMQSRFNKEGIILPVIFGTFHSIFYNIVKQSINSNINVISYQKKHELLLQVLMHTKYSDNKETEFLELILKRISYYKNSNLKSDNKSLCSMDDETFMFVCDEYNKQLREHQLIDFDDMMLLCHDLLTKDINIRKKYQEQFEFILIDEFQDINDLQYSIIKKLSANNNIFAVGDDDQSIYGFRGSNPNIMREFNCEFSNAKIIRLGNNYRSSKSIVEMSSRLINKNINRIDKSIKAININNGNVNIMHYKNSIEQQNAIIDLIRNMKRKNTKDNLCILYRNNVSASRMIEYLLKEKIECEAVEKSNNPYDNVIFKDFLCYVRIAKSELIDYLDFIKIMNKPIRYIRRSDIVCGNVDLTLLRGIYKDKEYIVRQIKKLENDINFMKNMDLYSSFYYFRKVIGYEEYIKQKYIDEPETMRKQIIFIEEIQEKLRHYRDIQEIEDVSNKLERVCEMSKVTVEPEKIYVMTYHASKGLEFDKVWLPDLIEGECPSSKCVTEEAIEEERRMLYVAMTRAKSELNMSYIQEDRSKSCVKSRFVAELEK